MIEIIPNWHPIFVHFALALLAMSAVFHVIALLNAKTTNYYPFENVANWNLWVGSLFAVITVATGWIAYTTVEHDTASHLAMEDHRNWAMTTVLIFVMLAIWSYRRAKSAQPINWLLALALIIATGVLGVTGYKGSELVYRHGLGVMSLPNASKLDHEHSNEGDTIFNSVEETEQQKSLEAAPEVGESPRLHEHNNEQDGAQDSSATLPQ